ncbi:MAG: M48 family metallopeptidase [Bacteriovoracaceae bacterium]
MKKYIWGILLLTFILNGCSSKKAAAIGEPSDEEINAESAKAYQEVKSKSKISTNKEWTEIVNRVSARIAKASGENFQWEWVLIESPEVNAWCMPGGKMAVYTGIMPVLKNEAALAAVMGHEVAHATRRHGKQRYARAMKGNIAGLVIGGAAAIGGQFLCKTNTCRLLSGLGGAAGGLAIAFFDRKFSRGDETEADQVGQLLMAKAGYEPSEAIHLWERMGANNQGKAPPEFMSTHPSDKTRRANLSQWLPQAESVYSQSSQKFGLGQPID